MRTLKIESLPSKSEKDCYLVDEIMLHACFQLLVNAIEKDGYFRQPENSIHNRHLNPKLKSEIQSLYDWWIGRDSRPCDPYSPSSYAELKLDDKDMLIRLINISHVLDILK